MSVHGNLDLSKVKIWKVKIAPWHTLSTVPSRCHRLTLNGNAKIKTICKNCPEFLILYSTGINHQPKDLGHLWVHPNKTQSSGCLQASEPSCFKPRCSSVQQSKGQGGWMTTLLFWGNPPWTLEQEDDARPRFLRQRLLKRPTPSSPSSEYNQ